MAFIRLIEPTEKSHGLKGMVVSTAEAKRLRDLKTHYDAQSAAIQAKLDNIHSIYIPRPKSSQAAPTQASQPSQPSQAELYSERYK